jgi:hypothetical protein
VLRINVVTIFPEFFAGPLSISIPARAAGTGGVAYNLIDLRTFTYDRHRTVDGTCTFCPQSLQGVSNTNLILIDLIINWFN